MAQEKKYRIVDASFLILLTLKLCVVCKECDNKEGDPPSISIRNVVGYWNLSEITDPGIIQIPNTVTSFTISCCSRWYTVRWVFYKLALVRFIFC